MKYVLYGLPCAGKTTLLNGLSMPFIHGSKELNKMAEGKFSGLSAIEKNELRIKYANKLSERTDEFISDGHYSFLNDVVFTKSDGELYDVFLYLYCKPEIIRERLRLSTKNSRFAHLSAERINKWQNFEIESLRAECHKRFKDFYVISDISSTELQKLIDIIGNGFGSYRLAERIAEKIQKIYPMPCELHICDGDKTIIKQDSFKVCTDGYITHVFDGNFYTDYQALQFSKEVYNLNYDIDKLCTIQLNDMIYSRVVDKNYLVLSSGVPVLWKMLAKQFGLKNVIADTLISADTKYFVVKILQEKGYIVTAYGDSMNDLYMLKQADMGFLYIGEYISRSLRNADTSDIRLLYDKSPYILADLNENIADDISICKSNSGINGSRLADAHMRLGKMIGRAIRQFVPNKNTAVIVLDRGGRFFGDGVYTGFGGIFYSYNPKKECFPEIRQQTVVIVDSVVNTGKSVLDIIANLKQIHKTNIFVATNVIQNKAFDYLKEYKVFAVRTSANSFIGNRQSEQNNGRGPDTADRLFNYID